MFVVVVQSLSHVRLFATPWTAACQAPLPLTISSHCLLSLSCPLSQWCHATISSSATAFSSCPQSFPAPQSFLMNWLFTWVTKAGASASALVLPMNIQGWFPLGLTGLISLLSKGLSSIFCSATIQKHQFFGAQSSSWSSSHIHTWLLEKPSRWLYRPLLAKLCLCFFIHFLGLSQISFQGASIFWFHGCSHHLPWFWSPRK